MVFKNRRRKFRRGTRRFRVRRFSKRFTRRVKTIVRRMSEVKWQFRDFQADDFAAGTFFVQNITPSVDLGSGKTQRIGQRIRYKFLQINWQLHNGPGALAVGNYSPIRLIFFWSRAQLPLGGSILDDGGSADNTNIFTTVRSDQARVIKDYKLMLGKDTVAMNVQIPAVMSGKIRRRIFNNVTYQTGLTIPQEFKDNLYVLYANGSAVTTAATDLYVNARISYIDI